MADLKKSIIDDKKELPIEALAIQCINNFKAPHATQDLVDQLAAEYLAAQLLRTHADKRYESAKRAVMDEFPTHVSDVKSDASTHMQKSTSAEVGVEWLLNFIANKPSLRVDVDELRTELIKQGINITTIDNAINKVSKKSSPALSIVAKLIVTG
jgi:hypothetical protein